MRKISKKEREEMIEILKGCEFPNEMIDHALEDEKIVMFLLKTIEGRKKEKEDDSFDPDHAPEWMIDDLLCRYQTAVIRASSDVLNTDTETERKMMRKWDLKSIAWMVEITGHLEAFNECKPWTIE